jgi:hypothetical protein
MILRGLGPFNNRGTLFVPPTNSQLFGLVVELRFGGPA